LTQQGATDLIIGKHLIGNSEISNFKQVNLGDERFKLIEVGVRAQNKDYLEPISRNESIQLTFKFQKNCSDDYHITLKFKGEDGQYCITTSSGQNYHLFPDGTDEISMELPEFFLNEMAYYVDVLVVRNKREAFIFENDLLSFNVNPEPKPLGSWMGKELGYIRGQFHWKNTSLKS
jgi:hypothetical protein